MYACVLKEWGREKTDHKHGHTLWSLQWCRKEEEEEEEEQGEENGNKVKKKKMKK